MDILKCDVFFPFTLAHLIRCENFGGFSIPLRTTQGTGILPLSRWACIAACWLPATRPDALLADQLLSSSFTGTWTCSDYRYHHCDLHTTCHCLCCCWALLLPPCPDPAAGVLWSCLFLCCCDTLLLAAAAPCLHIGSLCLLQALLCCSFLRYPTPPFWTACYFFFPLLLFP